MQAQLGARCKGVCAQQAAFVRQLRASVLSLKSCQEAPDYSIQEMAPYA